MDMGRDLLGVCDEKGNSRVTHSVVCCLKGTTLRPPGLEELSGSFCRGEAHIAVPQWPEPWNRGPRAPAMFSLGLL